LQAGHITLDQVARLTPLDCAALREECGGARELPIGACSDSNGTSGHNLGGNL
jgi:hypothetical protein